MNMLKNRMDITTNSEILESSISSLDIPLILEKLSGNSDCDFSKYTKNFIERRLLRIITKYNLTNTIEFVEKLSNDEQFYKDVILEFSINVTELFRDPEVFRAIRETVIPILKTYPFIRIWHAGCATGEEAYSMAILLHEMNLLDRCTIYATDSNNKVLLQAQQYGISSEQFQLYLKNYKKAGGTKDLRNYFTQKNNNFFVNDFLKENIRFIHQNLMNIDKNEITGVNMIFCRNVFIYFNRDLQTKILKYFCNSLLARGFLCMGKQETTNLIDTQNLFESFSNSLPIYQKRLHA